MAAAAASGGGAASHDSPLGCVEILRESGGRVWYCGRVLELGKQEDTFLVGFEGKVWPKASVPASQVRKPPRIIGEDAEHFHPKKGDQVEVRVEASEHAPAGWTTGIVRQIKHEFYFVAKSATSAESTDAIVEKDMLRPLGRCSSLCVSGLQQETFKIPAGLQDWASTPDALGCFGHIEDQSKLAFMVLQRNSLKMFGDAKAIMRAKMLLEVHKKHQMNIQDFQDKREKGLRVLEQRRSKIEGTGYKHSVDFTVDPSYIARIIGKEGSAVKALQEKYGVHVRIIDTDDPYADRLVKIFGNSEDDLERARADVQFVEEAIPVDSEMNSWIVGRGGKTIQGFKESCGLMYARIDREAQRLLLCGPKAAVADAVSMFESHIMYYDVFRQMNDEMSTIIDQLEEFGDYNSRWEWSQLCDQDDDDYGTKGGGGKGGGGRGGGGKGAGGKAAKGSKGGGKDGGKGGGKDGGKDDNKPAPRGEVPRGEKGSAKGGKEPKGKGGKDKKGSWDWDYFQSQDDDDESEDEEEPPAKGGAGRKGTKGKGAVGEKATGKAAGKEAKGSGKGKRGKGGEETDESESEDEEEPTVKKGGKAGPKGGKSGSRWQPVSRDKEEDEEDDDEDESPRNKGAKAKSKGKDKGTAAPNKGGKDSAKGRGKGSKKKRTDKDDSEE